jgi:hypothetical protein
LKITLTPKQSEVLQSKAREITFGGAMGGGKSFLCRAAAILFCIEIPNLQVALFRRFSNELHQNHIQGTQGLPTMLADYINTGYVKYNIVSQSFTFWNGSTIHLNHCNQFNDVFRHAGSEFHVLIVDEATAMTEDMLRYLRSRLRMSNQNDIPEKYKGLFPRIIMSCNPGGPSHHYIKNGWIDRANPGEIWQAPPEEGGLSRCFYKSLLADNPYLDKDYSDRLRGLGNAEMTKAYLEGNWDILTGSYFAGTFDRNIHVLPNDWLKYGKKNKLKSMVVCRNFDFGHAKPFAVVWCAELTEDIVGRWGGDHGRGNSKKWQRTFKKGSIIVLDEIYGWTGKPDEGVRWSPLEIAEAIRDKESRFDFPVVPGAADSSIYDSDISVAADMASLGIHFIPADKRGGTRIRRWQKMNEYFVNALQQPPEGPGLYIVEAAANLIRTLPLLERDPGRPDDIDTTGEDHLADALSYRLLQVPRTLKTKKVIGF